MEDRFEESQLDDILIDKDKNRFDKIKKIILLVASLALIFTLSIIVMKILNQDESVNNLDNKLPTEAIAQKEIKEPEPLFEQLPIKEETNIDDKFDKIVNDIKLQAEEEMKYAQAEIEKEIEKSQNTAEVMSELEPKMLFTPEPEVKVTYSTPRPTVKPTIKPTPKPTVKQQEIKPLFTESIKEKPQIEEIKIDVEPQSNVVTNDKLPKGYYLQVGAFKNVKELYLKNIADKGFEYQLERKSNITKVLIGPYSNRTTAKEALINVKSKIASGAYLTSKYNK